MNAWQMSTSNHYLDESTRIRPLLCLCEATSTEYRHARQPPSTGHYEELNMFSSPTDAVHHPEIGHNPPPADDVFNGRLTVSIDATTTVLGVGPDQVGLS